jgi:Protein of unknown function (DUF4058)
MPLRDHFHSPLKDECPWESFHSAWTNAMVIRLNREVLPDHYRALPQTHMGTPVEIDVVTVRVREEQQPTGNGATTAVWAPPQAKLAVEVDFADQDNFEVLIQDQSRRVVAAIELASPANKDRPSNRRDFAIKCASYLRNRVAVIIVDVVTERRNNLHHELMELLKMPAPMADAPSSALYAVAYRVREEEDRHLLELWPEALALGETLPTLPLWISGETAVPLELEATYLSTFEALRIG